MVRRATVSLIRRSLHATDRTKTPKQLPFEKPIFQSQLVDKAITERDACNRLEFYGNVAVVLAGISAVARLGYYVVYGKDGGAKALPRRGDL